MIDKILSGKPNAAGLAVNWQIFGSNGQDKADYSQGVLERFTRRAPKSWVIPLDGNNLPGGNAHVKTIANPRLVNNMNHPHFPNYFEGLCSINENGDVSSNHFNNPVTVEKIALNHYYSKSREEFYLKRERGRSDTGGKYTADWFDKYDRNEEFDDGILKYRADRLKTYRPPDKSRATEHLLNALMLNLSPTLFPNTPQNFYAGKLETFLTCRATATYLQEKFADTVPAKFFEETSLKAILKTLAGGGMTFADARFLIRELPELLSLKYPVVKDLRGATLQIIPQMMNVTNANKMWKDYVELDCLNRFLQAWQPQ